MELGSVFGLDEARGANAAARRDARLVRAIVRTGSRAKADTLVRAYYDEMLRFALRQITSAEDARDVTQEIFVAALRGLPGFDPRRASFRTWLYRIASNKVIDWLRSSRSTSATVSLDELDREVSDGCDEMGNCRSSLRIPREPPASASSSAPIRMTCSASCGCAYMRSVHSARSRRSQRHGAALRTAIKCVVISRRGERRGGRWAT